MVVGKLSLRLMIPGARSLKVKRQAIRSIKDRLRARLNVAVAEVDSQDYWQTADLGVCAIGADRASVEGVLDHAVGVVRMTRDVEVARCEKEFL